MHLSEWRVSLSFSYRVRQMRIRASAMDERVSQHVNEVLAREMQPHLSAKSKLREENESLKQQIVELRRSSRVSETDA